MTAKHTPGPWTARDENGRFIDTEWKADNADAGLTQFAPIHADGQVVALVVREDWDDAKLEADAALVSAAPDLFTALLDCVQVMERELNGLAVIQPELRQARAAIAKATGDAS